MMQELNFNHSTLGLQRATSPMKAVLVCISVPTLTTLFAVSTLHKYKTHRRSFSIPSHISRTCTTLAPTHSSIVLFVQIHDLAESKQFISRDRFSQENDCLTILNQREVEEFDGKLASHFVKKKKGVSYYSTLPSTGRSSLIFVSHIQRSAPVL